MAGDAPAVDPGGRERARVRLALLAVAAVFVLDVFLPLGIATGMLYVPIVLAGLWIRDRRFPFLIGGVSSLLLVTDPFLSPPGDVWAALVNRTLTLLAIWVAVAVVARYRTAERRLASVARRAADIAQAHERAEVAKARATEARAEAEESLRRTLKELSDIKYALDQSAIVAATDVRGIITYANDKFCEISKYARAELLGQDHRIVNSRYHPKEFIRDLWRTIAGGRIWHGEIRNRAKDGTIYWVDTTIVPFLDERGHPYQYMAIRYDITERKRSEQLLQEQAALTRLGQMAAVVAHEVKNPLAGIRGALQVIGGRLPAESRERAVMSDIVARIDTLNDMVQDLLLFARPRAPKIQPISVTELIERTSAQLRRDPKMAGVEIDVAGAPPPVSADPELLQAVFFNVLLNAAQAMEGRGRIQVTLDNRDGWSSVAVRDSGPGIPADVRERMFEPFFTTKNRGTGLGLAIARRVVELHGGQIDVECPPQGGTMVTVRLARP